MISNERIRWIALQHPISKERAIKQALKESDALHAKELEEAKAALRAIGVNDTEITCADVGGTNWFDYVDTILKAGDR